MLGKTDAGHGSYSNVSIKYFKRLINVDRFRLLSCNVIRGLIKLQNMIIFAS